MIILVMPSLNEKLPLSFLILKIAKILGIRLGFLWPTFKTKLTLKALGCNYGNNLRACGKIYFRLKKPHAITLGSNISLTARFLTNTVGVSHPMIIECWGNGRVSIGDHSGLTSAIISSRSEITIGRYVNVGANVRIFDHNFHSLNHLHRRNSTDDFDNVATAPVVIEDDVFIGTNAIILKGVHIGARSIIAAGSVVHLKSIPADSLVAGNPATIIKQRTSYANQ